MVITQYGRRVHRAPEFHLVIRPPNRKKTDNVCDFMYALVSEMSAESLPQMTLPTR